MKCWSLFYLLCLLVWSEATHGSAQGTPAPTADADAARQEAGVHFRQGVELFREGAFRAALVELERAQEISPDYRTLFNIGQTQLQLGEYVEAIKAFESYLEQGGSEIDPSRREDTEENLAQLHKRVATLAISVNQEGAEVFVDSTNVGKAPLGATVPVSVGRHRVFAQGAEGATASVVIDVAGGDLREIELALVAPTRVTTPNSSAPPPPLKPSTMGPRKRWAIGMIAGGAALGLGAGIASLFAKEAHDDYQDALKAVPGSPSRIAATREDMQLRGYITDGLVGAAVVLGVTSIVLFALGDDKQVDDGAKVELSVAPNGVRAQGVF